MHSDHDSETDAEVVEALRSLDRETAVPEGHEDQAVRALRERGMITEGKSMSRSLWNRVSWAAAAAILFFLLGLTVGRQFTQGEGSPESAIAPAIVEENPVYLLMLRESDGSFPTDLAEEELISEYAAWAGKEAREGRLIAGEKLENSRRMLLHDRGELQVDPVAATELDEFVSGYFLIRAADYEQAVEIASQCPHLKYGGTIEVREIYQRKG